MSLPFLPETAAQLCPVALAPMAGFTDAAMRRISFRHGASLAFTEMANARALVRGCNETWRLLETFDDEGPVVAHIYGSEPEIMAEAAVKIAATGRFVAVDINAGCPARKIVSQGYGVSLMKRPELLAAIVSTICSAVKLPVMVKTRLGLKADKILIFEILDAVTAAGAAALTLHARYATQEHTGTVHLQMLAETKQKARIPIIGNGGIRNGCDAKRMFDETGVNGLMIGRGAMGNPWIFGEVQQFVNGVKHDTAAMGDIDELDAIRSCLQAHIASAVELQQRMAQRWPRTRGELPSEESLARAFRCHLFRYLNGLKGASYLRGKMGELNSLKEIYAAVDACLAREMTFRQRRRHCNNPA